MTTQKQSNTEQLHGEDIYIDDVPTDIDGEDVDIYSGQPHSKHQQSQSLSGPLEQKLVSLAQNVLTPLGLEVLDIQVQNPGRNPVVVIRIDRLDEQPVSIDDLSKASRTVGDEYDRADPIAGEYRLELESPGAKRPLTKARHFERMLGLKARVRAPGHAFTAPIKAVSGDNVTFELAEGDVTLSISNLTQANLAEFPDKHR